jgi:HEAT repeat protein
MAESSEPLSDGALERDSDLEAAIQRFLDDSVAVKDRARDAWWLAREGSDQALAALRAALDSAPPALKASIAEGLGRCDRPEARRILLSVLEGSDDVAARGAIRGLVASQASDAAGQLSDVLLDPERSAGVRTEAALALGELGTPAAQSALVNALPRAGDPDVVETIIEGLGNLPFNDTRSLFHDLLESPETARPQRIGALKALGESSPDAAPFLLEYASYDSDPSARAAAAEAISELEGGGDVGFELTELLAREVSPEVRTRIYEAIAVQSEIPAQRLLGIVTDETNPAARLAGLRSLASALGKSGNGELGVEFDRRFVAELREIALDAESPSERYLSVAALRTADTPASIEALQEIAQTSDSFVARAARRALEARKPPRS